MWSHPWELNQGGSVQPRSLGEEQGAAKGVGLERLESPETNAEQMVREDSWQSPLNGL